MTYMLWRNRVADFSTWKAVFDSHLEAHQDVGLGLINLWRSTEDPNDIFFMFEVADTDRARAFISDPSSAEAGEASGVIDGEIHFVESIPGF